MADGGIGESALLSAALEGAGTGAAIGGGMSLLTGRDPLQGALMGGLSGGLFGGAGSAFADVPAGVDAFTAQTSTGLPTVAADASNSTQALTGLQEPTVYSPSTNYQDFGTPSPYTGASTNGIVGSTGGENVLQNQLGATAGGAPVNPMYTDAAPATGYGAPGSTETISPTTSATGADAAPAATSPEGIGNLVDKAKNFISEHPYMTAGGAGLSYLMNQERNKYGVPAVEKYNGPLSKFNYNPLTYKPDVVMPPTNPYRAQYASGGPVEQMTNENAIGANTGFPQAYMHTSAFASPYQTPISQNVLTGSGDTKVDPYTGEEQSNGGMNQPIGRVNMARGGGISSLGSYSDGGRMLKGPGDGMSDDIPAKIGGKQEARLADGEFVVSADVVSGLGNGSTDAGARQLYKMMDKVRQARTGRKAQGRQIKPNKYMPA
jgi:hypothetical protein